MKERTVFVLKEAYKYSIFIVLAVSLIATEPRVSQADTPPDSAASAIATSSVSIDIDAECGKAIETALSGNWEEARAQLQAIREQAGGDVDLKALDILETYLVGVNQANAERRQEYEEAVQRVRRSMLAQSYLDVLGEKGIEKNLRNNVMQLADDYNDAGTSESLELSDSESAVELQKNTESALVRGQENLEKALKLLEDDQSEYSKVFREIAQTLQKELEEYRQEWAGVDPQTASGRLQGGAKLRGLEKEIVSSLGDLESMIVTHPWRVGIAQARLAEELSDRPSQVSEHDWYKSIREIVEQQGRKAKEGGQWYTALRAYASLSELDPDNEEYKNQVKDIRRHVRVLNLYGDGMAILDAEEDGEEEADSSFAKDKSDSESDEDSGDAKDSRQEDWKDIVGGVDANMIRNTISLMDQDYVTEVDYRKVGLGALNAIRILVDTPEAVKSFPDLADEARRNQFIAALNQAAAVMEKKDRLDQIDLQTAYNSILRSSMVTVRIPVEVLSVEFAEGMLDELDRFSSMIWPYDLEDFRKQTMGKFYGVGIQIGKQPGEPLRVVTPLAGSPAYREGIKTDDLIIAVDGQDTENLNVDKLVRMITGEKGTKVVLTIKRPGMLQPKDYEIIREEIVVHTVNGWRRTEDGRWEYMIDPENKIGYIRITQFTDQTPEDVVEALEALKKQGMRSLVLDMRFNPGGLLQAAVKVVNEFLRTGRIVSTRGRSSQPYELNADARGTFLDGDIVVLINQYSASAAEIVAGALKDWRRAIVIGERTYGKGSVQNVIQIPRKSACLKLTTAYYYLPMGRLLHRENGSKDWGVDPDLNIFITPQQMKRWLDIRRKTDLIQEIDPEELTKELSDQLDSDIQLEAALTILRLLHIQEDLRPLSEDGLATKGNAVTVLTK